MERVDFEAVAMLKDPLVAKVGNSWLYCSFYTYLFVVKQKLVVIYVEHIENARYLSS